MNNEWEIKRFIRIVVDETTISHVVPELSTLTYQSYTVQELCDKCDFEEVAYLVLNGDLPNKKHQKNSLKKKDQKAIKTNFKKYSIYAKKRTSHGCYKNMQV